MSLKSEFNEQTVSCPVCTIKVPLKYPNPRLYAAARKDSDSRVAEYRWLEGFNSAVIPHYYAVWQCPQCYFANFVENLLDPRGAKENYLREAYKRAPGDAMNYLSRLHELVPKDGMDFNAAVSTHVSALYISLLPDREQRDHNRLARLYLRLGWLYREAEEKGLSGGGAASSIEQIQAGLTTLQAQIGALQHVAAEIATAADVRTQERMASGTVLNPYATVVKSLVNKIGELDSLAGMLQRAIAADVKTMPAGAGTPPSASSELNLALLEMKKHWPAMPMKENEALVSAVDAFEYSINTEKAYPSLEQALQVVKLMVELLRRIGAYDRALTLITDFTKTAAAGKSELLERHQKLRSAGMLAPTEDKAMGNKLHQLEQMINSLGATRRDIIEESSTGKRVDSAPAVDVPAPETA